MHLPLYLVANLVGDLRRTCHPTSHGRIRVLLSASLLLFLISSSLSSILSFPLPLTSLSPLLPDGPVHKTGTVSQAAGHPVTRKDLFEVFENVNSRDRTPNEISRCMHPRAVSLFSLSSLKPHCNTVASHARKRVKMEKDCETAGEFYRKREIIVFLGETFTAYFFYPPTGNLRISTIIPHRSDYSIRIWNSIIFLLKT